MTDSYDAELYELLHRGTPGDIGAYAERLEGMSSVLELGCGYGRMLLGLRQRLPGVELAGLDIHVGLLERARRQLPGLLLRHADMRSFKLDRSFDAIIIPYSGLWCLETEADLQDCLHRVHEHLQPGGRLIFDAYAAEAVEKEILTAPVEREFVAEVHTSACGYRVFESSHWVPGEKSIEVSYVYENMTEGLESKVGCIKHFYHGPLMLLSLMREVGFHKCRLEDGFSGEPFHTESPHLLGWAVRPSV